MGSGDVYKRQTEDIQLAGKVLKGPKEAIAALIKELHVIGQEELGGMTSVYVEGEIPKNLPLDVTVAPLNLQTYFVQLTKKDVA